QMIETTRLAGGRGFPGGASSGGSCLAAEFAMTGTSAPRLQFSPPGVCPSGQRERAVNPSAQPTEVRILPPPWHGGNPVSPVGPLLGFTRFPRTNRHVSP